MENDDWKPDSIQLVDGDHIHSLVLLDVEEVESCIDPSHSEVELQLDYLLDLFHLLNYHYLHAEM